MTGYKGRVRIAERFQREFSDHNNPLVQESSISIDSEQDHKVLLIAASFLVFISALPICPVRTLLYEVQRGR